MPWLKLDDQFCDHPKIVEAGPLAGWLHVCGMLYCARLLTDGFIPSGQVRKLADVDNASDLADRLIAVGLWDRADGGYRVHDYLDYNPSRAKVLAEREANAARQASYRERHSSISNDVSNAVTDTVSNDPPVPTPVPSTQPKPDPEPEEARESAPLPTAVPKPPRVKKQYPVTVEAYETADVLAECSWINDDSTAIEQAVARSFVYVPEFNVRDGPLNAAKFTSHHAKKPPTDWYRAWLNWIKNAVEFAKRDAAQPARGNGRSQPDNQRFEQNYNRHLVAAQRRAGTR